MELKKRKKTKRMWVKDKKEIEGNEEREALSCMVGVSGRFLCDIQVEART